MEKVSLWEFKTLLPYLSRYRWHYIGGFFCLLVVDGAQVLIPQLLRRAVDLISGGDFAWSAVFGLALAMVGGMAVISGGRFLWRYFIHGASQRIEAEMRDRLFAHLITLSYDFYQKNKIGDLMARSTNDLGAVRTAIGWGLVALVDGTMMAVAILVIIFLQDPRTAAFAVLPLPLITVLILLFGNVVGKWFRRAQETYSALSDTVQETFAGIRVVKSFVKEWWFIRKFAGANDNYRTANMGLVKLYGLFFPLISFLSGITTLILLLVGGIRVVEGFVSPGDLVALFSYLQMLIWPLMGAGFMVNMIQRGAVSLARVNEVLRTKPAILSPDKPVRPSFSSSPITAEGPALVEIRDLSFAYPGGPPVLEHINLRVKEGSVVGIMGRTGSGKSTLIKTLVRMVNPPAGTVLVKGIPVEDWDLAELRGLFGVTPQDSYLFSDSIKRNIGYGTEESDDETLARAAELSAIDQDLKTFNQGWDTLIGERGLTLSGGQKQRVAIARSLASAVELLILDDSLSAVDAETERRILAGLLAEGPGSSPRGRPRSPGDLRPGQRQGRTSTIIIVSHRVSTLSRADLVLVLDRGRIAERGSPEELAASGGFYARMAALQRLGETAEAAGG
jgi:ATP-binding cassette subfamily B protein